MMRMLSSDVARDQLVKSSSVHWCGRRVLGMVGGHVLRRALELEVEREAEVDMEEAG